jgi:hypothetical protein
VIRINFQDEEELPMSQSILQERDGFMVREDVFRLPEATWDLDPRTKRAVTICNLFVNHHYGISDVARVLDENRRNVVLALLKQGIIGERRMQQTRPPEGIEHRKPLVSPKVTLRTP